MGAPLVSASPPHSGRPSGPPSTAPEEPTAAGLWLNVDALLALPLASEARVQLWRLALEQRPQAAADQQLPLVVALARHFGLACAGAAADGRWGQMRQELDEAIEAYSRVAGLSPDRAGAARQELGNLIAKLITDLHASVHAEEPLEAAERAALCWQGYQLGQIHRKLQLEQPEWLWHLEEQLVREGAITLRQLSTGHAQEDGDPGPAERCGRQSLELLLHLGRLHQPPPEWILLAARELLAREVDALFANPGSEPSVQELKQVLGWTARLPLPAETATAVQRAAQRGIWSLQLLEGQPSGPRTPAPPTAAASDPGAQTVAPPAAPTTTTTPATYRDPRQLQQALAVGVAEWLAHQPPGLERHTLEPVLRADAPPVLGSGASLQLNVLPLLQFPQVDLLDQLVPTFFTPLQQAGRGPDLRLAEPTCALWQELTRFWQQGGQLDPIRLRTLVYFTSLWNRCGGVGALGAEALGWEQLPVGALQPGQSLLRPGNVELAALQTVLLQRQELEDLLAEIRRHHHDRDWMESHRDHWWFDPSDGCENLRRLHTNAGFYASSHAPLESLERWSQGTLRALLSAPILFGNDSITQMFWPVAQQLARQSGQVPQLVQWPGIQPFYDFIAGKEVLLVSPLAAEMTAHHRTGRAFALFDDIRIQPYGLRCIDAPMSIYPNRPARGFEDSLERTLEQIDRAYRQKPFQVFSAACGAYGLPLCEAVRTRYGVSCLYIGNQLHAYFGVLQKTTADWRREHRIAEHWITSQALKGVAGVDRIEGGRYLG